MKLNQDTLFTMAKVAGITEALPTEEQQKDPPGKSFTDIARTVADKAKTVGALAVGGVAALGKPQPPQKLDPRY
jgi:hypothetical protein